MSHFWTLKSNAPVGKLVGVLIIAGRASVVLPQPQRFLKAKVERGCVLRRYASVWTGFLLQGVVLALLQSDTAELRRKLKTFFLDRQCETD